MTSKSEEKQEIIDEAIHATCESCLFQKENVCHRYPPKLIVRTENIISTWDGDFKGEEHEYSYEQPGVSDTDWCGEHRHIETPFREKARQRMQENIKAKKEEQS